VQVDAYIRVSRVGGRGGDQFIAPEVQRERIETFAEQKGVEVIAWSEELDMSGARMTRPKLRRIIERIKAGETDGIVVADRSRFARSLIGALEAMREIEGAGGVFLAADGFDTSTPEGRLAVNILLSFAEWELDRIRSNWRAAVTRANARGIHVSAVPPLGYTRERGKGLVVDPKKADLVREAFRLRADGVPWRKLADVLGTSTSGARDVITNRAYLGEARGQYGLRNPHAHEALVDEELWTRAQPGTAAAPKAQAAGVGMLRSLVRCAGCGLRMAVSGKRYVCFGHSSRGGQCPAPTAISLAKLDTYVNDQLGERLMSGEAQAWAALQEDVAYHEAQNALDHARAELASYVAVTSVADLGADLFQSGVKARQEAIEDARRRLGELPSPGRSVAGKLESDLTIDDQRSELARFIDRVIVSKADPARKRWQPVAERVEIRWRGAS